jgi:hypothetical protein
MKSSLLSTHSRTHTLVVLSCVHADRIRRLRHLSGATQCRCKRRRHSVLTRVERVELFVSQAVAIDIIKRRTPTRKASFGSPLSAPFYVLRFFFVYGKKDFPLHSCSRGAPRRYSLSLTNNFCDQTTDQWT